MTSSFTLRAIVWRCDEKTKEISLASNRGGSCFRTYACEVSTLAAEELRHYHVTAEISGNKKVIGLEPVVSYGNIVNDGGRIYIIPCTAVPKMNINRQKRVTDMQFRCNGMKIEFSRRTPGMKEWKNKQLVSFHLKTKIKQVEKNHKAQLIAVNVAPAERISPDVRSLRKRNATTTSDDKVTSWMSRRMNSPRKPAAVANKRQAFSSKRNAVNKKDPTKIAGMKPNSPSTRLFRSRSRDPSPADCELDSGSTSSVSPKTIASEKADQHTHLLYGISPIPMRRVSYVSDDENTHEEAGRFTAFGYDLPNQTSNRSRENQLEEEKEAWITYECNDANLQSNRARKYQFAAPYFQTRRGRYDFDDFTNTRSLLH